MICPERQVFVRLVLSVSMLKNIIGLAAQWIFFVLVYTDIFIINGLKYRIFFSFIVTKVIIVIPGIKIIRNRKEELVKSKLDVDVDGAFPILYVLYFPESTATRANT